LTGRNIGDVIERTSRRRMTGQTLRVALPPQETISRASTYSVFGDFREDSPFAANDDPMWMFDTQTLAILEVNMAAIRGYGYSREQFLSLTILDIRPVEDVQALLHQVFDPNYKTGPGGELWTHRRKNGTTFHVRVTSHPVTFEGRRANIVSAVPVDSKEKI
jgi:PAS domain S-box-containing protein